MRQKELLRIRVLDALELAPATVNQLANLVCSSVEATRNIVKTLERENQVEFVDTRESKGRYGIGHPWKIYAIRGSVPNRQPLNVREERA